MRLVARYGFAAAVVLLNVVFMLGASSALAATPSAQAAETIAGPVPGEGAGQVNDPEGVAVDESSGAVYVADRNNWRIDEFDEQGHFLSAFGFGVRTGAGELQTCTAATRCVAGHGSAEPGAFISADVAVDQSSHDVYVSDGEEARVDEYTPAGEFLLMFGKEVNKTKVKEGKTEAEQNLCTKTEIAGGDVCGAGTRGSGPGQIGLNEQPPVAVDSSGDVWVGDLERLEEFNEKGEYVTEVQLPGAGVVESLAVDASGDFYLKSSGVPGVRKLEPDGLPAALYPVLDEAGHPNAVALDPATGDLFISDQAEPRLHLGTATLLEYDSSGAQTEAFGAGEVLGGPVHGALAFGDTAHRLYVLSSAGYEPSAVQAFGPPAPGPLVQFASTRADPIGKTGATLDATVNPEGVKTTCHFQYVDEHSFESEGGFASPRTVTTPESASIGEGFEPQPASFSVAPGSLAPATVYRFRVVAHNEDGAAAGELGEDGKEIARTFTTLPPVAIDSTYVTDVASTSATLQADINPLGDATAYHFEYLTEAQFLKNGDSFSGPDQPVSLPVPEAPIGAGEEAVAVSQHPQALLPATVYRFRVLARNEVEGKPETTTGPERTFTTQTAAGGPVLPDGRRWEMVSPPDKQGALIEGTELQLNQASDVGDAITYYASLPTESEPRGYARSEQVLSTRTSTGWNTRDIGAPFEKATGFYSGAGEEYRFFSEDLSLAVLQPYGSFIPASSPHALAPGEASEQTAFLRNDTTGAFLPLVTRANDTADPFQPFGEEGECSGGESACGPAFEGASPDGSHIFLSSRAALTSPPSTNVGGKGDLYEWSGGRLQPLVAVLPASGGGAAVPLPPASYNDGTSFFSHNNHLYDYDFANDEPVRLDVAQGVAEPSEGGAGLLYASSDGSTLLFSDSKQLTKVAGGGIYECRIVQDAGKPTCELQLTGLESTDLSGTSLGNSEDLSYLYFLGAGDRLYVDHDNGGEWTRTEGPFVGPHAARESLVGGYSGTYRISPNGRYLAFMSDEELTGYDNRDAVSGEPDEEVYLYDAVADKLVCASCNPTGARPAGILNSESLIAPGSYWNKRWLAANIPTWTLYETGHSRYQSRYLSDSGRLLFNSHEALVPRDVNGAWDVYEYEPSGVGTCGTGSSSGTSVYVAGSAGCTSLISSGSTSEESRFIDASQTGGDVFFATTAQLAPQDHDTAYDIYDAHECTTQSPCPPAPAEEPPPCDTEASCKAAREPQPPIYGLLSSATFSGPGNIVPEPEKPATKPKVKPKTRAQKLAAALKVCHKKMGKKQAGCEEAARKRYGPLKKKPK